MFEIYGVRPDDFQGTFDDFLGCIHPDDRERVRAHVFQAYQTGQGFQIEERIVRPDGEIRYLQSCGEFVKDARGNVVQMLGICQDVTDRSTPVKRWKQRASSFRNRRKWKR